MTVKNKILFLRILEVVSYGGLSVSDSNMAQQCLCCTWVRKIIDPVGSQKTLI